jgi:hypothetical protein
MRDKNCLALICRTNPSPHLPSPGQNVAPQKRVRAAGRFLSSGKKGEGSCGAALGSTRRGACTSEIERAPIEPVCDDASYQDLGRSSKNWCVAANPGLFIPEFAGGGSGVVAAVTRSDDKLGRTD